MQQSSPNMADQQRGVTQPVPSSYTGHAGPWMLWALAAALPALTTRNPAYLLLLLLVVVVIQAALPASPAQSAGWWRFLLKVALFLWLLTIPLNALTVHYGQTVLLTLPRSLPLVGGIVGGPITLEAVVYGFLSGMGWLAVLAVFILLNRAVDPYQLLRVVPPVFFQTGVMASIALTFLPQAALALREIREAQAIRGHRGRGLRDAVPLFMPLLTTGLERSFQLAESMEARGFGSAPVRRPAARRWGQRLLVLALVALLAGLLCRALRGESLLYAGLLLAGVALLVLALALHSRGLARTRYRQRRWSAQDTAVALCSGLGVLAYAAVLAFWPGILAYSPYPRLEWPAFQPAVSAFFLALTAPAWFLSRRTR